MDGDDEETIEKSTVKIVRSTPAPKVSNVSSSVLTSGEDGFDRETREVESLVSLRSVFRDHPIVGSGGGIATIEIARARYPRVALYLLGELSMSRIIPRVRIAHVALRVRRVLLRLSRGPCFPGLCSSPPSPVAIATKSIKANVEPPSCIVA